MFFFDVTLNRGELMAKMQPVRMPRTLPVVLSRDEVVRLIAAAPNLNDHHDRVIKPLYSTRLPPWRLSRRLPARIRCIPHSRGSGPASYNP